MSPKSVLGFNHNTTFLFSDRCKQTELQGNCPTTPHWIPQRDSSPVHLQPYFQYFSCSFSLSSRVDFHECKGWVQSTQSVTIFKYMTHGFSSVPTWMVSTLHWDGGLCVEILFQVPVYYSLSLNTRTHLLN